MKKMGHQGVKSMLYLKDLEIFITKFFSTFDTELESYGKSKMMKTM